MRDLAVRLMAKGFAMSVFPLNVWDPMIAYVYGILGRFLYEVYFLMEGIYGE